MTEMYLGQREQIAWVDEAGGYGLLGGNTITTNGEIVGKNVVITPDESQGYQEIISAGADTREVEDMETGPLQHRFTLNFSPVNWKWLLFCAHGSSVDTGAVNFVHTFSLTDAVTSFTLEWAKRGSPNEVITYTGCVIKRARVRWSKGTGEREGHITVEAECLAQSKAIGTTISSVAVQTLDTFKFHHTKLTYNSSEFVEINNGEFLIDNGIEESDSRYANSTLSRTIGEPIPRKVSYLLTMNVNQKDSTFSQDFIDAVAVPGTNVLEFVRTDANDKAVFTFTSLFIISPNNPTNLDGISTQDIVARPLSVAPVINDQIAVYF